MHAYLRTDHQIPEVQNRLTYAEMAILDGRKYLKPACKTKTIEVCQPEAWVDIFPTLRGPAVRS